MARNLFVIFDTAGHNTIHIPPRGDYIHKKWQDHCPAYALKLTMASEIWQKYTAADFFNQWPFSPEAVCNNSSSIWHINSFYSKEPLIELVENMSSMTDGERKNRIPQGVGRKQASAILRTWEWYGKELDKHVIQSLLMENQLWQIAFRTESCFLMRGSFLLCQEADGGIIVYMSLVVLWRKESEFIHIHQMAGYEKKSFSLVFWVTCWERAQLAPVLQFTGLSCIP